MLRNYMEALVDDVFEDISGQFKSCKCKCCEEDIKAIALNSLPPKYAATSEGEIYLAIANIANQYKVDVMTALINADRRVAEKPRHRN